MTTSYAQLGWARWPSTTLARSPFGATPETSSSKTLSGSCGPRSSGLAASRPWTPLLGFIDPLRRHRATASAVPCEPKLTRRSSCHTRARSVLVVPPDLDGFLRSRSDRKRSDRSARRGFVAPRNRPWGSPCFRNPPRPRSHCDPKTTASASPARTLSRWRRPFEAFPSLAAWPSSPHPSSEVRRGSLLAEWRVHRRSCPLVVVSVRGFRVATVPLAPILDLRAFFHQRVRSALAMFPSESARCSLGLCWEWIRPTRCSAPSSVPRSGFPSRGRVLHRRIGFPMLTTFPFTSKSASGDVPSR